MAASATSCTSSAVLSSSNDTKPTLLYKFKITLIRDSHRPRGGRWRRVVVPANFSLLELHVVIQVVFGWTNSHLHHFMRSRGRRGIPRTEYIIKQEYGDDDFMSMETKEERIYKLSEVFDNENPVMEYEYDFGDCLEHEVKFEGVVDADPKLDYPACIEGKWANRVDDHQDEDENGDLLPGFEGKKFDLKEAQEELRRVFDRKWPLNVDNATIPKCYLCGFHLCSACNGRCCEYCLKADIVRDSGTITRKKNAELKNEEKSVNMFNTLFRGYPN